MRMPVFMCVRVSAHDGMEKETEFDRFPNYHGCICQDLTSAFKG